MAELSKIRKNGVDYDIKDAVARKAIEDLEIPESGVTDEQIASAVEDYFAENPVDVSSIVWRGEWDEAESYSIGDAVSYNGSSYVCITKGVPDGFAPDEANPDWWMLLAEKGEPGDDYVLTSADKQEIAEQAAELVEVPEGGTVTDEQIAEAVKDYMAEHPVTGADLTLHIGPEKPTNGALYWLDTSGDSDEETDPVAYSVTTNLTKVTIDNTTESVNEGESYAAAITAADGYTLSGVSVMMGSVDVTGTSYASGNIYIASVTGNIVITATAVEVAEEVTLYTITNNLVKVTSDNTAVSVEENSTYTATLTAETDYGIDTVSVTMGGVDVTADVYADGVVNIPAVTGDVVITAFGVYYPNAPVFELAEPYTSDGSADHALEYNIVDEDKTFSVAIDFSATPTTGVYVLGAGYGNDKLGIRGQGNYYWYIQSSFYKTGDLGNGKVNNKKVVLTYEKASTLLYAYHVNNEGVKTTLELAKGWKTGADCTTSLNPNGTVNDLKIYARVLSESEINTYLGVE